VSALAPELRICLLQTLPNMALQIGERMPLLSAASCVSCTPVSRTLAVLAARNRAVAQQLLGKALKTVSCVV
jgi:hypothetical protein